MRFVFMALLLGAFSPAGSVGGEDRNAGREIVGSESSAGILGLALSLEKENDYYRAITEYKRVIHLRETPESVRVAWLGVCRSYTKGRKWPALENATKLALGEQGWEKAEIRALYLMRALSLWNLLRFSDARDVLKEVPVAELGKDGHHLMAWVSAACADTKLAREHFEKMEYSPIDPTTFEAFPPEGQSPWMAGTLSAILPGAGQLYAGKPQAAIGALVVNAILIAATVESFDEDHEILGAGLGFLALGFYVGNIYGAVSYVTTENRMIEREPDAWLAKNNGMNENFRDSLELSVTTKF